MAMFSSIVVGTDGSETAEIALKRAVELAALTGAKLHVVSAYEPSPARVGGNKPVAEAAAWSVGSDFKVDAVLQRARDTARGGGGVEVEVHAPKGDAADALIKAAEEHDAGVIVLGSRGMRGARRVLGSVPNKVSHNAPCDVLIVHTT
jgi:nucleotide-binding universal stress UspA family protein